MTKTREIYKLKNGWNFHTKGEGSTSRMFKGNYNDFAIGDYIIIYDEDIFLQFLKDQNLLEQEKQSD